MFHLCDLCAHEECKDWLAADQCYCWKRSWTSPMRKVVGYGEGDPKELCSDFEAGRRPCEG